MIEFKQTDFPDPVVPAISKWGISARSSVAISPVVFLPMARFNLESDVANFSELITDLKYTVAGLRFGISIPTEDLPGMGAITRTRLASMTLARSSESWTNLFTRTPSAGSTSNNVITGPGLTLTTFPSTPNVNNDCVRKFARSTSSSRLILSEIFTGVAKRSDKGS